MYVLCMYTNIHSVDMYLLCMTKARSMENVLTLGKLLSLWFCFLLHSIFFYISNLLSYIQNISSNELARPVMGTIFLVVPPMSSAAPAT